MPEASRAVRFRRCVNDAHLLHVTSNDEEDRFIFELNRGTLKLPQHPEYVRRLLALAAIVYGSFHGEHAELLKLVALREELEDAAGLNVEVAWRHVAADAHDRSRWVSLRAWIDDQFLMSRALRMGVRKDFA